MIIKKCTFKELPDIMQMHVLYREKVTASEYRLAVWNIKDTIYYNGLKGREIERLVTLIESKQRCLDCRTMNGIYNRYGSAVYFEIKNAHDFLLKKEQEKIADGIAAEYMPIIEKAMDKPSIPLNHSLLRAMSHAADKGHFKFEEWSTDQTYIYFMGYLLGSKKLKWDGQLPRI